MKDKGPFRFKRFSVRHDYSSMKVGVDGVMLGCWADVGNSCRILDVGTGCGVIALICAQRAPEANIEAIDIDTPSVEEAAQNFSSSSFAERLAVQETDFLKFVPSAPYDHIISNPPFFNAGIKEIHTSREGARHQVSLNIMSLVRKAKNVMTEDGALSLVLPADQLRQLTEAAISNQMDISRLLFVRGHASARVKRILAEVRNSKSISGRRADIESRDHLISGYTERLIQSAPILTMLEEDGSPTPEYHDLCRDFYIRF